ncbi:hypothetical protein MSP8886_04348 [Marinomonas spartinae]|uniref:Uncharacterized protein n=1 Tax=Marinomonas spartinae TaxID=1792290 RepID=A0A1A8TT33_9GAMM|nr:hypothetical protein MSP8886_04348 [Marinomonas spartinae]
MFIFYHGMTLFTRILSIRQYSILRLHDLIRFQGNVFMPASVNYYSSPTEGNILSPQDKPH